MTNGKWYNFLMTTPDRNEELLQAINTLLRSLEEADTVREKRDQSLREYIDAVRVQLDAQGTLVQALSKSHEAVRVQLDAQGTLVQALSESHEAGALVIDTLGEWNKDLNSRMDGISTKVDGLRDDIGLVKGGHARNAMRQNLPRIADGFGFQFISEVPQAAVIGFSKVAIAQGEAKNEAESFRNADTVIYVLTAVGQPGYVAIEASFTVDSNDVGRAVRNSDYLARFTGLPAYAAVAGVEILPGAQAEIDAGKALLYRIPTRELQSE